MLKFRMRGIVLAFCAAATLATHLAAETPSIEKKTEHMTRLDGFFPLYWDQEDGHLWLEVSRLDNDFLYVTSLAAGLGSNDIGLDRGQPGDAAIVAFQRVGQ